MDISSAFPDTMKRSRPGSIGNRAEMPSFTIASDRESESNSDSPANGRHCEKNADRIFRSESVGLGVNHVALPWICCVVADVYYLAKISVSARRLGVRVEFVNGERDLPAELADMPVAAHPSLIVVDLNNTSARPLTLIPRLRAKLKKSASIIGFVSCAQGDRKACGARAGCDIVVSRPAFSRNLPKFLRRYGLEGETVTIETEHTAPRTVDELEDHESRSVECAGA